MKTKTAAYQLAVAALIVLLLLGCSKDTDNSTNESLSYDGTLTVVVNGDGFSNETLVYTKQEGSTTYLWAIRYYENAVVEGGPSDYSAAQLYYNAPAGDILHSSDNGLANIAFAGNSTTTENIQGSGITAIARGEGVGVDFQIKRNGVVDIYYIDDAVTTGTLTVSEYGDRVKGTFNIKKLRKFLEPNVTVDITGSFDLANYGKVN